jgi:large subunit ribosomal protein L28
MPACSRLSLLSAYPIFASAKKTGMAKICELSGKKPLKGNAVSHSNRKTIKHFAPNLQTKRFFVPELNKWITLRVSTHALRNINKKGLYQYIREQEQAGKFKLSI